MRIPTSGIKTRKNNIIRHSPIHRLHPILDSLCGRLPQCRRRAECAGCLDSQTSAQGQGSSENPLCKERHVYNFEWVYSFSLLFQSQKSKVFSWRGDDDEESLFCNVMMKIGLDNGKETQTHKKKNQQQEA